MADDPELTAMSKVIEALEPLDDKARQRVIAWAVKRYGVENPVAAQSSPPPPARPLTPPTPSFANFHDLFEAASPTSAVDHALLGGYWFQVVMGQPDFDGGKVNDELRNLGRASTNIARDFGHLMARSPRPVMQVGKDGARKRYKLTTEGIKSANALLSPGE